MVANTKYLSCYCYCCYCCRLQMFGATGVAPVADLVCFTATFIAVPDDPNLRTSAGQGVHSRYPNYDQSMRSDPNVGTTWRCDSAGHGGPFGLGQSTTAWYKLPADHSLATMPPGGYHCGTDGTGWLTGWPAEAAGHPDSRYATPADGSLPPPVGAPPASGTVCFDDMYSVPCYASTSVRAVSCGSFALWELPPPIHVGCFGYCLEA
eukprot:SAG31_NODE_377_length_16533_cov_99.867957_2_plen_207_part_00